MQKDILLWFWEILFFVFLFCVYLYYQYNLRSECRIIDKAAAGWETRKSRTVNIMRPCFRENLIHSAGQNNLYFITACLILGGAGSLLWMAVWAPVCVFLRFVQTLVLWEEGQRPVGTAACFHTVIREQMHFASASLLSKLYVMLVAAAGICGLHCWGIAQWVIPLHVSSASTGSALPYSAGVLSGTFLLLGVPVCVLAFLSQEQRKKLLQCCLLVYGVALLILMVMHGRLLVATMEMVVGDGFQLGNSVSAMAGKGHLRAAAVGTVLACCLSGLPWDDSVRRYVEVGRQAAVSPVTAGLWAMKQATLELFFMGGGTSIFLLMIELARITSLPETMKIIVAGDWGLISAAGVILLCGSSACLAWNRWLYFITSSRSAACAAVACLVGAACLTVSGGLLWMKILFSLLLVPLLLNLLLLICLAERFRSIMDRCKKEIEINLE